MIKRITVTDVQGHIIGHDWYIWGLPIIINTHRKMYINPVSNP